MKNFYPLLTQAAKGFAGVQVLPLCLMLMLAGNKTDAQVNCNFSLPNGNNNPLTVCLTGLQVSISGVQGLDSLIFYLPNNVSVQSAPAYSQASYTGSNGIHQLKWNAPIAYDTIHLTLLPLLCKFFNDNSSININNVSFQCVWWLGGSGTVSTYSTNISASGNSVSYNLENPNISIIADPVINGVTYLSNIGDPGPGGSVATRYTAIKLTNTPVPSPLYYKFTQEGDATHLGLWAVHPDSGVILLSGTNTGPDYTFRIDTFIQHHPGYLLGSGRHILLKQEVLRKCTPQNLVTPVKAQWVCAGCNPTPESAVITLNTVINPAGTYSMQGLLSAVNACADTIYSQVANGSWNFTPADSVCCNNVFKLTATVKPVCDSTCNGSVLFKWSGGLPPYQVSIIGGGLQPFGYGMQCLADSLCAGDTICINVMDSSFAAVTKCVVVPASNTQVVIANLEYKPCFSDSVLLQADSALYYIWYNATDTLSWAGSVFILPPYPMNYYVTGTDSFGCASYDTVFINVDTFHTVINTAYVNLCDSSNEVILSISTNYNDSSVTYQWEPATGLSATTGSTVTANPMQSLTYSVIAHHEICSQTHTVTFSADCCLPIQAKRVHSSGESASQNQWLYAGTLTHSRLDIQGHLTVDANLTLSYDTIGIYSNKQIIVQSGVTLTIQNSILYGCKDLWSGIRLEPGAKLIINNSLILDADTAIVSRSNTNNADAYGYYQLNHVTFNKNRYGIVQMPHADLSNTHINIRGCTFDCQGNALWSVGSYLKSGSSERSHTAIVLDMGLGGTLTLGDGSSGSLRNEIYRHLYGIRSGGGSLSVINTLVQYLYSVQGCAGIDAVGLWHKGGNLTVQPTAGGLKNYFDNCRVGVLYESGISQTVRIEGNEFSNIGLGWLCAAGQVKTVGAVWVRQSKGMFIDINGNAVMYSERGIRVVLCSESDITVKYNEMNNNSFNISITETGQSQVLVYENQINHGLLPAGYGLEGITISQVIGTPGSASITGNRIMKVRSGITGNNCTGILVENNQVQFPQNVNGAVKYGIRINGCNGAVVVNNIISKEGAAAVNGQQNQLFGITAELCTGIRIYNNIIARCGTAIRLLGDNSGGLNAEAQLRCNRIINYYYGIRLDAAGIGAQGNEDNPGDNRWEINSTVQGILDYVNVGNSSSDWWVRDDLGRPWWVNTFSAIPPPIYDLVIDTSISTSCNFDYSINYRRGEYGDIIRNRGRYSLDSINAANDYMFKWQVFSYIIHDSTYLSYGDILDAHFISFADTFKYTVAGYLGQISEYLRLGDTLQAQQYLSTLVPNDSAEYVYKQVLRIYECTWARGIEHIDSALLYDLHKIALRHPHHSGTGVYMARVMGQEDYDDFLAEPESSRRSEAERDSTAIERFILYPNPIDGMVRYEWGLEEEAEKEMVISDMQGRELIHQSLPQKQGMVLVNLVDYPSGIYLLQLFCNGSRCNTQKIIKQ